MVRFAVVFFCCKDAEKVTGIGFVFLVFAWARTENEVDVAPGLIVTLEGAEAIYAGDAPLIGIVRP